MTAAMIAVFIGFAVLGAIGYRGSSEVVQITVEDKEATVISDGDGRVENRYLIFTKEGEVFENTDALTFGKFNSSDIQARLKVDSTYNVLVAGWRIPVVSSYRNIIEIR